MVMKEIKVAWYHAPLIKGAFITMKEIKEAW